jgi:hypothetical protein
MLVNCGSLEESLKSILELEGKPSATPSLTMVVAVTVYSGV